MKGINERRQMTEAQYNKVMRDLELLRKAEQAIASIEICTYDPLTNKPTKNYHVSGSYDKLPEVLRVLTQVRREIENHLNIDSGVQDQYAKR